MLDELGNGADHEHCGSSELSLGWAQRILRFEARRPFPRARARRDRRKDAQPALVGMTGVGGGSLMTPLLILLFGVPWWAAARSLDGSQSNSIMSVPRTIALAIVVIRAIGPGNAAVTRVGR